MGCYDEEYLVQRCYDVTLTYNYNIKANTEKEAKEKAMAYYRSQNYPPISSITVKERKRVKKTIHYSVQQYYKQDVLVDEDMDEDEIIDLWSRDKIETLNEPVVDGDDICLDEEGIWVS